MDLTHVSAEPGSLVQVEDQCQMVEAWAAQCDSVPELRDAGNKLSAIDEYLARTSTDGRARVALAQRNLEARIGDLIGPGIPGRPPADNPNHGKGLDDGLNDRQRSEFRQLAGNRDVIDDVAAESTDDDPPSRRKVMKAIKQQTKPQRSPLAADAERAGWQFRKAVERLEAIAADDRFPSNKRQVADQIGGHLSYAIEVLADLHNQLTGE